MKKRYESAVDRVCRSYGVERFGEKAMALISSDEIEEIRCNTFKALSQLTDEFGKLPDGTAKGLACGYIAVRLAEKGVEV